MIDKGIPPKFTLLPQVNVRDVNVSDIMLDAALTNSFISDNVLTLRDEDAKLSFEEKCAKYLGLNETEIERVKVLIKKDQEDVDD